MSGHALILFCLATTALPVYANGGGYFRGGVERTGDIAGFEPESTQHIRILDEKLTVNLGQKSAGVDIRYLMRNESDQKVKVRFGFPVEELFDNDWIDEEGEAPPSGKLKYCQNYILTAAGKAVTAKWQSEENPGGDNRFKGIAGWLVSEITFAAGEEKPVSITFRSGYPSQEWNVSEDSQSSAAIFKYRLSTAACWAGTIGKGEIILKPDGISPFDLKVLKPVNRFKKQGDDWVWNFENLEPTLADDLEIEAIPEKKSYNAGQYIERSGKWTMTHTNYAVTASSTLPAEENLNYDAVQIKEFWDDNAWSEGTSGPGIGEWLELKPEVAKPLTAISLLPGYWKSGNRDELTLFQANARPKKILVELNGEYRFTVDVPDEQKVCEFAVPNYTKPVTKVRLTFEDVWKGKLHEDLCVSGVRLHVRLDQKPQIQPSR